MGLLLVLVSTECPGVSKLCGMRSRGTLSHMKGFLSPQQLSQGKWAGRQTGPDRTMTLSRGSWGSQAQLHTLKLLIPCSSWTHNLQHFPLWKIAFLSSNWREKAVCQPLFETPQALDSQGFLGLRGGERESSRRMEGSKTLLLWKWPNVPTLPSPKCPSSLGLSTHIPISGKQAVINMGSFWVEIEKHEGC